MYVYTAAEMYHAFCFTLKLSVISLCEFFSGVVCLLIESDRFAVGSNISLLKRYETPLIISVDNLDRFFWKTVCLHKIMYVRKLSVSNRNVYDINTCFLTQSNQMSHKWKNPVRANIQPTLFEASLNYGQFPLCVKIHDHHNQRSFWPCAFTPQGDTFICTVNADGT